MFIPEKDFYKIFSPKKACQRGLEEYITNQVMGDKQVYTGEKPAYLFMNNPVYRVGKEGDPAPMSLSSRHSAPWNDLKPTESPVHLLYPTIDSGSVSLDQKAWDMRWLPTRQDIPNVTASPEQVGQNNAKMNAYNQSVADRVALRDAQDRRDRLVPIYDLQGVADQHVPDGVHEVQYSLPYQNTQGPIFQKPRVAPPLASAVKQDGVINVRNGSVDTNNMGAPFRPNTVKQGTLILGKTNKPTSQNTVKSDGTNQDTIHSGIEGYTNVRLNDNGYYGYPQPSSYASMGTSLPPYGGYELFPKHLIQKMFPTNLVEQFTPQSQMASAKKAQQQANKKWFTLIIVALLLAIAVALYYM